jgi:hypothetical protein
MRTDGSAVQSERALRDAMHSEQPQRARQCARHDEWQVSGIGLHRTGQYCTNIIDSERRAIFYPNFYPKVQQSEAETL